MSKKCWDLRKIWWLFAETKHATGASGHTNEPGAQTWGPDEVFPQLHLNYPLWQHNQKNQSTLRMMNKPASCSPSSGPAAPRPGPLAWAMTLNEPSLVTGMVPEVWSMLTRAGRGFVHVVVDTDGAILRDGLKPWQFSSPGSGRLHRLCWTQQPRANKSRK